MFHDLPNALMHLSGLREIVHRRGGLDALKQNVTLRIMLFWCVAPYSPVLLDISDCDRVDVNAAFMQDSTPRFPLPEYILPEITSSLSAIDPVRGLIGACQTAEMRFAMNLLQDLSHLVAGELSRRDLWNDGVFAGMHVVPVLHHLLSTRHEITQENSAVLGEESCRLGAILYLGAIRLKFGLTLTADVYVRKLKDCILLKGEASWDETPEILIWLLVLGGIQSTFMEEEHAWFIAALASHAASAGYMSWEDLMSLVREVLWIDKAFEGECVALQGEITTKSRLVHHCTLS